MLHPFMPFVTEELWQVLLNVTASIGDLVILPSFGLQPLLTVDKLIRIEIHI